MRYAFFSDIHGNLAALRAVFDDIEKVVATRGTPIHQRWCLGDIVGYGPQPGECLQMVRRRCDVVIPGNHDWVAIGKLDIGDFSEAAAESAAWTRRRISEQDLNYLRSLPEVTFVNNFTLSHGSPFNPIWEYLTTAESAAPSFPWFDTMFALVGHTHLPTIFLQPITDRSKVVRPERRAINRKQVLAMAQPGGPTRSSLESGEWSSTSGSSVALAPCERWIPSEGLWRIPPNYRAIINPGSVGQPRDGDARASYVIYDSDLGFEFRRVPYDIAETRRKILQNGLPESLAERLEEGS
jgi:diadenosine tetraphosphatase ApaH/serine/threonine PP2A family protein phosphatase